MPETLFLALYQIYSTRTLRHFFGEKKEPDETC